MRCVHSLSRRPAALFGASAVLVVGICIAVLRSRAFAANPDLAAWGITFDLTISLPLLYWFFVVRGGKARPLTIVPVFLLGTMLATALIPHAQQAFLRQLGRVVVPVAELLLVTALVGRIIAARREPNPSSDPYDRIAKAANTLAGEGVMANVITSEAAMFYYAFFGWRRQPPMRERAVTFHERNGWSTILACILVIIAAEGLAMHLLLAQWKSVAAWCWTALDLWALIWLLGDYQALRLRRTWIDDEALHIQYGLRWTITVPREQIASVEEIRNESWKRKEILRIAILDAPRWKVTLREPLVARGLLGLRKRIVAIALLPDDDSWIANLTR